MSKLPTVCAIILLLATGCVQRPQSPIQIPLLVPTSTNSSVARGQSAPHLNDSMPANASEIPMVGRTDTKLFSNADYGFTFVYPARWTPHTTGDLLPYFTAPQAIDVLDLDIIAASGTLDQIVEAQITANNCRDAAGNPYDRVLRRDPSGALFVTYCTAGSEIYSYLFNSSKGYVIRLRYHDDFEDEWSLAQKLKTFERIIDSLQPVK